MPSVTAAERWRHCFRGFLRYESFEAEGVSGFKVRGKRALRLFFRGERRVSVGLDRGEMGRKVA